MGGGLRKKEKGTRFADTHTHTHTHAPDTQTHDSPEPTEQQLHPTHKHTNRPFHRNCPTTRLFYCFFLISHSGRPVQRRASGVDLRSVPPPPGGAEPGWGPGAGRSRAGVQGRGGAGRGPGEGEGLTRTWNRRTPRPDTALVEADFCVLGARRSKSLLDFQPICRSRTPGPQRHNHCSQNQGPESSLSRASRSM